MKTLLLLSALFVAATAWAPPPEMLRDVPPCAEDCVPQYDERGFQVGNACVAGTYGYWCVATVSSCAIQNEHCVTDPGGEGDFPLALAMSTRAWHQVADQEGATFLARLTCDPGAIKIVPSGMVAIASPSPTADVTIQEGN